MINNSLKCNRPNIQLAISACQCTIIGITYWHENLPAEEDPRGSKSSNSSSSFLDLTLVLLEDGMEPDLFDIFKELDGEESWFLQKMGENN